MEKTGYLGPEGSYSHLAAQALAPSGQYVPYPTFYAVIRALKAGECGGVVLPIENSLNGGVFQNIDILQETDGIIAVGMHAVRLDHRLAYLPNADLGKIKRIYSHVQALQQCAKYLYSNFPEAELYQTASTSASLDMIKSAEDAGIVGAHVRAGGFSLSAENIADEKNNFTTFLYVVRGGTERCKSQRFIYFSATCLDKSGALIELLAPFSEHGINMTKIESRPIKDRLGEYRFFIEIEGGFCDGETTAALEEVRKRSNSFKILGCY